MSQQNMGAILAMLGFITPPLYPLGVFGLLLFIEATIRKEIKPK